MQVATHDETEATAVATQLLERLYPLVADVPVTLEALPDSSFEEGTLAYRVRALTPSDSPAQWVLRAHQADQRMPEHFRYFYPWACSSPTGSQTPLDATTCHMEVWLRSRAATLTALEAQAYLGPRVVPTGDGALLGAAAGWCTLLTTFVPGTVLTPTLAQLRRLGGALGRLHALPVTAPLRTDQGMSAGTPGPSYWHPKYAIPGALARLQAAAPDVPNAWRPWHTAFAETLEQMQQVNPPVHLIHGDVWSANAVADASAEVILIDWDQGGQGPAIADLGRLLLECHLDTDLPTDDALAWHITPDPARIEAVVEGYARERIPAPAELETLLVGMRFGIAFIGALHLDQALHAASTDPTWLAGMDRRFARLQNRFLASEEITELATAHFARFARAGRQ
jgi:Ser/Thr protein kinase RdoA (MazF antagonist)